MEPRAHHVLIGTFTVVVVACALLFGLWLAKAGSDEYSEPYDIVFNEAVSGLSIGSVVHYSGIQVGEVVGLALDPDDPRRVVARIRIHAQTPMDAGTRARLTIPNITGSTTIQLSSGPPGSPPLDGRRQVPVIVADPSPIAALQGNSEVLLTGIATLVENANQLMSPDNVTRVGQTLEHLVQASAVIAEQREDLRRGVQGLGDASQQAGNALREATELLQRMNALLEGEGGQVVRSAAEAMAALERATRTIDHLVNDNREALGTGMLGVRELGPALAELRVTLTALGDLMRRIEQGPSGYLLGGENVREFQP